MKDKICAVCRLPTNSNLHHFPADIQLRDAWTQQTGIDAVGSSVICSIHFNEDQWERDLVGDVCAKRLKKNAVPSLFLKEFACASYLESRVPELTGKKRDKCAICRLPIKTENAVAIFDEENRYTNFGVSLSLLLHLTSRAVSTRFSCSSCSQKVLKCFNSLVNLNISVMIANRRFNATVDDDDGSPPSDEEDADDMDDDLMDNIIMRDERGPFILRPLESYKSNPEKTPGFKEKCPKCDEKFNSKLTLSCHFLIHLFQDKLVHKKSIAVTQTSEFDIETGGDVEIAACPSVRSRKRKRREEKKSPKAKTSRKPRQTTTEVSLGPESEIVKEEIESEPVSEAIGLDVVLDCSEEQTPVFEPSEEQREEDAVEIEMLEEEYFSDNHEEAEDKEEAAPANLRKRARMKEEPCKKGGICHLCGAYLQNACSLARHLVLHEENELGPQNCPVCRAELKNKSSLEQHMRRMHRKPGSNYKACDICGKVRGNLYQHRKNCRRTLSRAHKRPKRPVRKSFCGICSKAIHVSFFPKHLKMHEIEEDVIVNGPGALDKYLQECKLCGKRVKDLAMHLRQSHDVREEEKPLLECEVCGSEFLQRPLLVNHMVLKHGANPRVFAKEKNHSWKSTWTCAVCAEVFNSYAKIKKHTKDAHEGVGINLSCEACGKYYNTLEALREHINVKHIEYFPFRCEPCDRYFATESGFELHARNYCRAADAMRMRLGSQLPETKKFQLLEPDTEVEYYEYPVAGPQDGEVVIYVDVPAVNQVE